MTRVNVCFRLVSTVMTNARRVRVGGIVAIVIPMIVTLRFRASRDEPEAKMYGENERKKSTHSRSSR